MKQLRCRKEEGRRTMKTTTTTTMVPPLVPAAPGVAPSLAAYTVVCRGSTAGTHFLVSRGWTEKERVLPIIIINIVLAPKTNIHHRHPSSSNMNILRVGIHLLGLKCLARLVTKLGSIALWWKLAKYPFSNKQNGASAVPGHDNTIQKSTILFFPLETTSSTYNTIEAG